MYVPVKRLFEFGLYVLGSVVTVVYLEPILGCGHSVLDMYTRPLHKTLIYHT